MVSKYKIFKVFPIIRILELYVAMATRVQIQSAKNLMQPFPKPDDALNEIWLKLVYISTIFQLNRGGSSWVEPVLS